VTNVRTGLCVGDLMTPDPVVVSESMPLVELQAIPRDRIDRRDALFGLARRPVSEGGHIAAWSWTASPCVCAPLRFYKRSAHTRSPGA